MEPTILKYFKLFIFAYFVSFEFIANPSNAALFPKGWFEGEKTSLETTLFREFLIKIFSSWIFIFAFFRIFLAFDN